MAQGRLHSRRIYVVYSSFISDSLHLKIRMDVSHPCYQVRGAPQPEKLTLDASNQPQSSPQLKLDKKAREYRTPSPEVEESPLQACSVRSAVDDELSRLINEMKQTDHLPLERSDNDCGPTNYGDSSDAESDMHVYKYQRKLNWQKGFACMQKNSSEAHKSNPNARTIEVLEQMAQYYDRMRDGWRVLAYRRAINTLKTQTVKITTKDQAFALPNIGARLALKIEEIALTNRLQRLENAQNDPNDAILQKFTQIYGVGLQQASKWLNAGYRTLDDVRAKAKLTPSQEIGLAHYEDFLRRIPRDEVAQHGAIVREVLGKIDPAFEVRIMGSYLRGAESSGDVDLIITKPGGTQHSVSHVVFEALIPALTKKGFLKAALATAKFGEERDKWHGCSCLPGSTVWRRIDFLVVPWDELGAATIYFTGNDIFNRSIRLLASKKGMRLNQRGLYKNVMRSKAREKLSEGELVESKSEKRIFEILGVPWRAPTDRNA